MSLIHQIILALLIFTAVTYCARVFVFRERVRHLLGFFDGLGELGHSGCAVLMVPMVVPWMMADPGFRFWSALLSLAGGLVFAAEGLLVKLGKLAKYPQYRSWWSFAHAGMYLGMAHMYWIHDHVIVSVQLTAALTFCAGAFFVWFCGYYLYALIAELIATPGVAKKLLYLQANVAHLFGIGLPMLGMVLWPGTFMAMGGHEPAMTHHPTPNMHQHMPMDADHPAHDHPMK